MSPMSVRRRFPHFNWRAMLISAWLFAIACDLLFLLNREQLWYELAFYGLGTGLAIGTLVALAGFMAWLRISDPHWRAIGVAHMTAYLMVALLLAVSLALRTMTPDAQPILSVILSGVAIALFLSSTWIDEELRALSKHRHSVSWMG